MEMCGVCLITRDVRRLADFYSSVLETDAMGDDYHVAFEGKNLAIWNHGVKKSVRTSSLCFM
ncbi:VOC family protein [Acidaminobacter sp. JC074]|uniref:VOC family protein n=1 Tax=Acidaminobacter sp. JC074 TaxID=2530199 RepID=UPI001F0D85B3|nr:hypothetical protein [Acidaminobacter sp. JC074]